MLRLQLGPDHCHSANELENELATLQQFLTNANLLQRVVQQVSDTIYESTDLTDCGSIVGDYETLRLLDCSPDSHWSENDSKEMIEGILETEFGKCRSTGLDTIAEEFQPFVKHTMFDILTHRETPESLLIKLKNHFNQKAKTGSSSIPSRVDIVFTFAAMSAFLARGFPTEDITSMRRTAIISSLEKMCEKQWLPERARNLYQKAIRVLLD